MARLVFCEAYKEKMFGGKYVWIITGFYTKDWWKDGSDDIECTEEEMDRAVDGYFSMSASNHSITNKTGISGKVIQVSFNQIIN